MKSEYFKTLVQAMLFWLGALNTQEIRAMGL